MKNNKAYLINFCLPLEIIDSQNNCQECYYYRFNGKLNS